MIQIEHIQVTGWEAAIRGARNPMNSWEKSDSAFAYDYVPLHSLRTVEPQFLTPERVLIGREDKRLLMALCKGGSEESKWRRFIDVTVDVTAPLYWWKEADTYKVGTVANSCSTMHKIAAKEFTLDDFSCEHLINGDCICADDYDLDPENEEEIIQYFAGIYPFEVPIFAEDVLKVFIIPILNKCRERYIDTKDKMFWWQMIQLLPTSYNQKRTLHLNYEVLASIYRQRNNHKLDEWREFCAWIESLPYSEFITLKEEK